MTMMFGATMISKHCAEPSELGCVQAEIDEVVKIGYLNGLFVLARSIGLIGHALDQQRLQQPLYRHPWDEVLYTK